MNTVWFWILIVLIGVIILITGLIVYFRNYKKLDSKDNSLLIKGMILIQIPYVIFAIVLSELFGFHEVYDYFLLVFCSSILFGSILEWHYNRLNINN
jgi:Na+/proline symporter